MSPGRPPRSKVHGVTSLAERMTPDQATAFGPLVLAAGAHAGVLMVAAGLGVSGQRKRTRLWLLQAANQAAASSASWRDVEHLAALVLIEALEIIFEGAGPGSPAAVSPGHLADRA